MHSHFSGYMRKNDMPIVQFHPEHRIGQRLDYNAFNFNRFFFCHITTYYSV